MPVRKNGYYADPALGAAFDNLAAAFATPSGADVYGYTKGAAEREKAGRLAELFNNPNDPNFDRKNIAVGNYSPIQSFYAQNQNDGTTRRGQDVTAGTARDVAGINNAGALARQFAQPVILGEGQTAFNPPATAAATGLPQMFRGNVSANPGEEVTLSDGSVIKGAPKPMTNTEVAGAILQSLPKNEQRAVALAPAGVSAIVGDSGPTNVFTADSVGKTPYEKDTRQPQNANYKAPDGATGTATMKAGKWFDTQTGVELPAGSQTYTANLQGDKDQTGLGTGTKNNIDEQLVNLAMVEGTSKSLRSLLNANPGSQGLVGAIRGTVQDAVAAGGEVAQLLNVNTNRIKADIASGRVDPDIVQKFANFDPSIPAVNMLETLLTAQMAKMYDPGGRVSNASWNIAQKSIGAGGMLGNVNRTLAALDILDSQIASQRATLAPVRPAAAAIRPIAPAGPPAPPISGPSTTEVWERGPDGQLRRAQ